MADLVNTGGDAQEAPRRRPRFPTNADHPADRWPVPPLSRRSAAASALTFHHGRHARVDHCGNLHRPLNLSLPGGCGVARRGRPIAGIRPRSTGHRQLASPSPRTPAASSSRPDAARRPQHAAAAPFPRSASAHSPPPQLPSPSRAAPWPASSLLPTRPPLPRAARLTRRPVLARSTPGRGGARRPCLRPWFPIAGVLPSPLVVGDVAVPRFTLSLSESVLLGSARSSPALQ